MPWSIDERIAPFVQISEVDQGSFFAAELFRRKYGDPIPTFGHHVVAFYRRYDGTLLVASYCHLWTQGAIGLVGGACTDGEVLRATRPRERELVNEAGGLLRQTLRFFFFTPRFCEAVEAFFGHCGDRRAREVVFPAGFAESGIEHLIVRFTRDLAPERQQELVHQAHAIGPF
jgi:hypothetical protein